MIYIGLFVLILLLVFVLVAYFLSAPRYTGPITGHFDGKAFINPGDVKAKGLKDVLKWMSTRKREPWAYNREIHLGPRPPSSSEELRITFVNHSTFLIQYNGINILTDPVWSQRVSPFQWAGPKRNYPPGLRFEDLPKIDYVLISHNHYDHLDLPTARALFQGHQCLFIVPLGVDLQLTKKGFPCVALDWWQEYKHGTSLQIQAVPAQHFSGRGGFDRDATLWCGYILTTPNGNVYFAGDTGYNENTFKEIGRRTGPIAVSLIPIGAYMPTWFMSPIHCSPAQAVKIHQDVKSRLSIGSHFGTFALADEGEMRPVSDLEGALKSERLSTDEFITLKEGQSWVSKQ
jgi:L-ascorbate metabolism protein UlaG (beta-lactamase superfamily)